MPIDGGQTCERRGVTRHKAHLVTKIRSVANEQEHLGVTQNIGITGALLVTRAQFATGERVLIDLYVGESRHRLRGRIVRAALLDRTRIGVWKSEAAIEFDETLFDLEPLFLETAKRQASLTSGGSSG